MVRVDMIITAGALLTGLVVKAQWGGDGCLDEYDACDETCKACHDAYVDNYNECFPDPYAVYFGENCDELEEHLCCSVPGGCEANAAWVTYEECANAIYACGEFGPGSCGLGEVSGSDGVTSSDVNSTTTGSSNGATTTEADDDQVVEEDDDQEDADAGDTDASSGTTSTIVGGVTAMLLAVAVSSAVIST